MVNPIPRVRFGRVRRSAWAPALLALSLIVGCVSPKAPPSIDPGSFSGHTVSLETSNATATPTHVVTIQAPSPGWSVMLDQERPLFGARQAYITLRRPSPLFVYPQVAVTLHVASTCPASVPLEVYLRTLDADAPGNSDTPYTRAHTTP